jgi:hypothetical protein
VKYVLALVVLNGWENHYVENSGLQISEAAKDA